MAAVESGSGVCRVGNVGVDGVGHLVADDGELVKLELGLVLPVDALVSEKTSGSDLEGVGQPLVAQWLGREKVAYHVGGHAITNEEDDILSLALLGKVTDKPLGSCLLSVVVVKGDSVLAGLIEGNLAVGFGGDVDDRGRLGVLGEEVLVPGKLPGLYLGLLDVEGLSKVAGLLALLGNGDGELLVGLAVVSGLGAVDGSVDLDTEVEELTRKEVALVRGQDAAEVGAGSQTLVGLGRDLGDGRQRSRDDGGVELDEHCGGGLLNF